MTCARKTRGPGIAAAILTGLLLSAPTAGAEDPTPGTGERVPATGPADVTPGEPDAPEPLPRPRIVLDEVSVTATRAERDPLDVPANVTIIDRETIERSGARDVPDLLRREPGVFVTNTTTNPEGYSVELRGFNNGGGNGSGTLVMVDGRRVNEPGLTNPDWSYLHLRNVERIEIVRGPASAIYGDNAIAGVIHIVTRSPEGPALLEVSGRTGTYDTDAGSLFARGSAGPLSVSVFADDYKTHGYRERSDFRGRHADGKVHVQLGDWGRVGLSGGYSSDTRQRPGDLTRLLMAENRRQEEPGGDRNVNRTRERYANGFAEIYLPFDVTLEIQAFHRRKNEEAVISDPFSSFTGAIESDSVGVNSQIQWDSEFFGHENRLIVGFDWLQEDRDSESFFELFPIELFPGFVLPGSVTLGSNRSRRKLAGLFLQNEFDITEDLMLTLGVRRESLRYRGELRAFDALGNRFPPGDVEFRGRGRALAPKAALTWRISEPLSVYASYSFGYRFPNIDEAFGFFGFSPSLEPQESEAYEVGVKFRNEIVTANVTAYTMNVKHEIFFDPLAINPLQGFPGLNVNLDRVRHRGVEVYLSVRPFGWLELYGGYTLDNTKITRDKTTFLEGFWMPITPRHRGNAGVRAQLPWWIDFSVNANFVGRRYVANDVRNQFRILPKFAVYDAQVAFRPPIGEHLQLALTLTVRNLTNRRYNEFAGRSTFAPITGYFPSPDRNYEVGAVLTLRR